MALYDDEFTTDQRDYFDLLCDLVEAYDKEHADWPKVPEGAALKHLLAEREMTGADLSRVLGGNRNLGANVLRGERRLTVDHVRALDGHFGVSPSVLLWLDRRSGSFATIKGED